MKKKGNKISDLRNLYAVKSNSYTNLLYIPTSENRLSDVGYVQ